MEVEMEVEMKDEGIDWAAQREHMLRAWRTAGALAERAERCRCVLAPITEALVELDPGYLTREVERLIASVRGEVPPSHEVLKAGPSADERAWWARRRARRSA